MRAAPIGAFFATDPERLVEFVERCTRITHSDPRALTGAKAVAILTAWCVRDNLRQRPDVTKLLTLLRSVALPQDDEWTALIERLVSAWEKDHSVERFADELGLEHGVSGYVYHTVPVVIYAWYRHFGDFEATISAALNAGGDADTTGAIVGALAGAVVGEQGIPADWVRGVIEWPRTSNTLRAIADRLAEQGATNAPSVPVAYFWPAALLRNLVFLVVVLVHGFRRLLPPY
jgi:ADP-ribosylglycohydrolase